jgi:hypothetical protein
MLRRILIIAWLSAGALGLGIMTYEANRRSVSIRKSWFLWGLLLGPIFLFFVLPWWIGSLRNRE